jgi:predicted neuraminidase
MIERRFGMIRNLLAAAMFCAACGVSGQILPDDIAQQPGFVSAEFIATEPPTAMSHTSTIVQTKGGELLVAWIGGSRERARDMTVWASRNSGKGWSEPEEIADGIHDKKHERNAVWNPVLFEMPNGSVVLFYKEGDSPETWWGMYKRSFDKGRTWGEPVKLPSGIFGPIRSKPIELASGTLLCGSSVESSGWMVHMERAMRNLEEWTRTEPINSSLAYGGAIQPTLIPYADGRIQALCRTKHGKIFGTWSEDQGMHWSRLKETELPNPNSAIDAVILKSGKALLVYNHSQIDRSVLNVAVTSDGKKWQAALLLENTPGAEFSYPAVIQTSDGKVHITYTWKKIGIRHVVVDPAKLNPSPIVDGRWPR